MFDNTIKFCTFILPIVVILFLFPLGKGSQTLIEEVGIIIAWIAMTPVLIIFSWDLAGCIIYLWENRKDWRNWLTHHLNVVDRIALTILLFFSIALIIFPILPKYLA